MKELKKNTVVKLMKSEKIHVVFSARTRMPFVVCDPETFDDQILVYFDEEDAKNECKRMTEEGDPCVCINIPNKGFLPFYMSLFFIGANSIYAERGKAEACTIELSEFVQKKLNDDNPKNPLTVENPSLHLTMLYFLQEMSRKDKDDQNVKELDEELRAHFKKSKFLIPFQQDGKGILLNINNQKFQPVFTDYLEYEKFDREKKLKLGIITTDTLIKNFPKEADGVIINPSTTKVLLNIAIKRGNEV